MINVIKEVDFSKTTKDTKEALAYYFPGVKRINIPFFWNESGNTILVNKECKFYIITKEIIERVTESDSPKDQMIRDMGLIKRDFKGENISYFLTLIKYLYSLEEVRRTYISNRIKKAKVC
jgi:hypothetical protein